MTTEVWARFESKGKPQHTKTLNGTNRSVIMAFAEWMQEIYMGSHIRVTIARSESELEIACQRGNADAAADQDMMGELNQLLGQGELLDGQDQPAPHMPEED